MWYKGIEKVINAKVKTSRLPPSSTQEIDAQYA